jgi:hypothetical protein
MKPNAAWHFTPVGRVVRFLGSIQLAVPVLVLVAAALAWGTYLESTQSAKVSKATVYGSWWFMGLMCLISVSLVFAVVTRYPWKRKHVGFITVHAGLLLMIAAGFWSLFERIEGHVALEEGNSSDVLEMDEDILELAEFQTGHSHTIGTIAAPTTAGEFTVGGIPVQVVAHWVNTREELTVANDSKTAFRAIEISANPAGTSGEWIGDEARAGGASTVDGLVVRVLADGTNWTPPPPGAPSGFFFVAGGTQYPLAEAGAEAFPGWTIVSVQRYQRATVSGGKLTEGQTGQDNPAVDVVITDGKGTTERHTVFQNFPDMVMAKTLEGAAASGAKLSASGGNAKSETLVVFGTVAQTRLGYIAPDGTAREIQAPASFPAVVDLGNRRVAILKQYASARPVNKLVPAPTASERLPAVVVRSPATGEEIVVAWKSFERFDVDGRNLLIRYGPRQVQLPFTIHLKDFRKVDYPGTEMAMAYESDVTIKGADGKEKPYLVHMNTPYAQSPWKVYQSGFMGDNVSVFSIMKDPGIPLTYLASIVLCVGIFLTFFSRRFTWGHPGIPAGVMHVTQKETSNALPVTLDSSASSGSVRAVPAEPIGAGI